MAGEESTGVLPQPAVNNFVRAAKFAARSGWCVLWLFTIRIRGFRTGGPGLLTTSRVNDFELIDQPAGRPWPLTTTREGVIERETTLLYCRRRVKARGTMPINNINTTHHEPFNASV